MSLAVHPENNIQWAIDEGAIDHSCFFCLYAAPSLPSLIKMLDTKAVFLWKVSLEIQMRVSFPKILQKVEVG